MPRDGRDRPADAQRGAARRTLLAWLAALPILAAALLAAITWGPHLARDRIASRLSELLGRELRIDRIEVSPFAGRLTVSGLRIAGPEAGEPSLSVEQTVLVVSTWHSLTRREAVVRSVMLQSPSLTAIRFEPNRLDLSELADRLSGGSPARRETVWRIERIDVRDGRLALDDRVVGHRATIGGLRMSVLGLTNRDEDVDRPARLEAVFTLNGRDATLAAEAAPFADPPSANARVSLDALPLMELLPWLPLPADIRPRAGALDLELRAEYGPDPDPTRPPALSLEGSLRLDGLRIEDAQGLDRVAARSIAVGLARSRPLEGMLHVASVEIDSPQVAIGRAADGSFVWPTNRTARSATGDSGDSGNSGNSRDSRDSVENSGRPAASRGSLRIDRLSIDRGELAWQDAALPAPLALRLAPMRITADALAIDDLDRPGRVRGAVRIDATADDTTPLRAEIALDGQGAGVASFEVERLELPRLAALAGPALRARVERGRIDARGRLDWGGEGAGWSVSEGGASLSDLRIVPTGGAPANIATLSVAGVAIDPTARRLHADSLAIDGARIAIRRTDDGRFDLQDWYVPADVAAGEATPGAPREAARPWSLVIRETRFDALDLDYQDARAPGTSGLPTVRLVGRLRDLSLDPRARITFEASAALQDGSRLSAGGSVRPVPLELDARLQLQRLALTHFDPYLAPFVNATLASGQLWGSGRLTLASEPDGRLARIGFDGEVSANEFRALDKVSSDDFLRWTALAMPAVRVDWRTGRPADSIVEIGEVAFVDFYSRIILSPEGRLNLADLLVDTTHPEARRSLTSAPEGPAEARTSPAQAPARAADAPRPLVRIGTVRVASGNVNFTDLFIRPNYSAHLSQLVGVIEGIASDRDAPSEVLITGRVDDDAPLELVGKINPLAPRRFIDLRAVARGFDLPKLSPYSSRWAGYAIEKGKLTADVRYTIQGETLSAENRLTLNQLTFGDKVDSPDATSLPVSLAVSLLKDRDGNIALDLPISGTLSDPQFSVGALLWRALGNLIVKVVSSPFTLLASLGGAGEAELSHVDFAPGETGLDDEDRKRLDALGRGLTERPGVSLEIAGYADPLADREAMQRERLENMLRAAKLVKLRQSDPRAELPPLDTVRIEPSERPALLEQRWREAGLDKAATGKPPPPEEIERTLLEHPPIAAEEVRRLAQRRAQAARDYLRDTGGVSNERLYLLAPRLTEPGDARPPSRADFAIR